MIFPIVLVESEYKTSAGIRLADCNFRAEALPSAHHFYEQLSFQIYEVYEKHNKLRFLKKYYMKKYYMKDYICHN